MKVLKILDSLAKRRKKNRATEELKQERKELKC